MAEDSKQTIYIDVDDEITSIVEKVRDADKKIVALVLPKRAATLQSIVNMKLLKRTADEAGKKVVLITSEAGLLPLAGAVKLHVAKTLQSKPAIPPPPEVGQNKEIVAEDTGEEVDSEADKNKTVGELAGVAAVAAVAGKDDLEDTIDVDSVDDEPAPKSKGKAAASKLKVPNFDSFRKRLFLIAGGAALLVVLLVIMGKVLPKAHIVIKTNSTDVNVNLSFTANTDQKTLDTKNNLVPATIQSVSQSSSQTVQASGQKNIGDKASGDVTMSTVIHGCASPAQSVPAGTTISNGVVSYVTDGVADFSPTGFSGGNCTWTSNSVSVTAANGGAKYNVAAGSQFSVSGFSATATNAAAMSGGTDKTVTILTQADVDGAKQKASQDNSKAQSDLKTKFQGLNLYALPPTLQAGKQTTESSAQVGDQATNVTVTVTTQYTMLGVKEDDLKKLIDVSTKDQINSQKISDYGLDSPNIVINTTKSPANQTMSLQTTATAGASIDTEALKQQITGKKEGDVKQMISDMPGVQDVTVDYSPFWVTKAPKPSKITIVVQKQQASSNGNSSQ